MKFQQTQKLKWNGSKTLPGLRVSIDAAIMMCGCDIYPARAACSLIVASSVEMIDVFIGPKMIARYGVMG